MDLFPHRRSSRFSSRYQERSAEPRFDLVLWGVPVALIAVSGLLIASTQRQAAGDLPWLSQGVATAALLLVISRTATLLHAVLLTVCNRWIGLQLQTPWLARRAAGLLRFPLLFFGGVGVTLILCKLMSMDGLWLDHWITGSVGLVLAVCVSRLPLQRLSLRRPEEQWREAPQGSPPQGNRPIGNGWSLPILLALLLVTIAMLLAVNLFGTEALGAQRWLVLGPFQVQPSEFAKLSTTILVAAILDRFPIQKPVDLLRPFGVVLVPWALVLIQPDLGTSLVFGAVLLWMLYWSAMPWQWLLLLLSPLPTALLGSLQHGGEPGALVVQVIWIVAMGTMAWRHLPWRWIGAGLTAAALTATSLATPWLWEHGLKDYQRDRLTLFLNPSVDPLGGGYHVIQSTIGIGSGGFSGTGLLQGQLTRLQFIPEQHTDFIFSALGEELGFVGCVLVVSGFGAWAWRLLKIATLAKTDFESFLVIGILAMVMFQVVVNVFMTTGLGPVTGIPLPFMSYGRSALLMNCLGIGLVAAVERRCRQTRSFS